MNAEELSSLVSTADLVAGKKQLTLTLWTGDTIEVTLTRLTYSETLALRSGDSEEVGSLEILRASLPPDFPFERLEREVIPDDCQRAHMAALFLSWPMDRQKKMLSAATAVAELRMSMTRGALSSNSNANASAPATDSPRSDPGLCPGSFCNTESPSAASGGGS